MADFESGIRPRPAVRKQPKTSLADRQFHPSSRKQTRSAELLYRLAERAGSESAQEVPGVAHSVELHLAVAPVETTIVEFKCAERSFVEHGNRIFAGCPGMEQRRGH